MILVVNICREKLHYYEFVKPVGDILKSGGINFEVKNYLDVSYGDLKNFEKVIICGTSLLDDFFIGDLGKFEWIKSFDKPLLGICGGFQILGLTYGGKLKNKTEIGFFKENFSKDLFGLKGEQEVYHLHNNFVKFSKDFESFTNSEIWQAVKHKTKPFYGVLFHPEVRQKNLILEFLKL
jgi:GMP synthase (glutamine-hydrolysing)